jgi:hypothetical protein
LEPVAPLEPARELRDRAGLITCWFEGGLEIEFGFRHPLNIIDCRVLFGNYGTDRYLSSASCGVLELPATGYLQNGTARLVAGSG